MEPHSPLAAWETFFFLIGSSAAALTGLQFVVIALIAGSSRRATTREIEAFSTPTIVHFAGVLLVSAIVSAPWYGLSRVAIILGACGFVGIAYTLNVIRRTQRQTTYRAVFEDWLWHVILPLIAYVLLLVSAVFLPGHAHRVLFVIGATTLLLLFIGLHNAWDTVTYITIALPPGNTETQARADDQLPPVATTVSDNKQAPQKPRRKFRGRK
jgi:hypothetical protein